VHHARLLSPSSVSGRRRPAGRPPSISSDEIDAEAEQTVEKFDRESREK
jgi:hypothetical protein